MSSGEIVFSAISRSATTAFLSLSRSIVIAEPPPSARARCAATRTSSNRRLRDLWAVGFACYAWRNAKRPSFYITLEFVFLRLPLADTTSPASDTYHHARVYHEGLGPIIEADPIPKRWQGFWRALRAGPRPGNCTSFMEHREHAATFVAIAKRLRTSNLVNIAT
jgi:hypothetical protein